MAKISNASRLGFIRKEQFKRTTIPLSMDRIGQELNDRENEFRAEKCRRDFSYFMRYFWDQISNDPLSWNWHIDYLTSELMKIAEGVGKGEERKYDLIINIPPGTTKSITCSIMFPVWCWINWPWFKFIVSSYSGALALEHAEMSRDLVRSVKFKQLFPEITIKTDKDTKSNFRLMYRSGGRNIAGGSRLSTSVGGTLTGFHGHILIVDDPLDPNRAVSPVELKNTNRWMDQTLSTRKVNKNITPTVLIMQRLHQDDPTGHILAKNKMNVKHISLPGEIKNYPDQLQPPELASKYIDSLLDPKRMPWKVMQDMESTLGQYGYSGQVGQNPVPPTGGMFKADLFIPVSQGRIDDMVFEQVIRYWDKAGTAGAGAYTAGVKMAKLKGENKFVVLDVRRGQFATDERERLMRATAEADGPKTIIWLEQEPGSGGKDSALASVSNLSGFVAKLERPTGDKAYRADPYSVQVNNGNVMILQAAWTNEYIEEHRFFPFGTYKDQVDASSGGFNKLNGGRRGWVL